MFKIFTVLAALADATVTFHRNELNEYFTTDLLIGTPPRAAILKLDSGNCLHATYPCTMTNCFDAELTTSYQIDAQETQHEILSNAMLNLKTEFDTCPETYSAAAGIALDPITWQEYSITLKFSRADPSTPLVMTVAKNRSSSRTTNVQWLIPSVRIAPFQGMSFAQNLPAVFDPSVDGIVLPSLDLLKTYFNMKRITFRIEPATVPGATHTVFIWSQLRIMIREWSIQLGKDIVEIPFSHLDCPEGFCASKIHIGPSVVLGRVLIQNVAELILKDGKVKLKKCSDSVSLGPDSSNIVPEVRQVGPSVPSVPRDSRRVAGSNSSYGFVTNHSSAPNWGMPDIPHPVKPFVYTPFRAAYHKMFPPYQRV